jgi:hypothetical protein
LHVGTEVNSEEVNSEESQSKARSKYIKTESDSESDTVLTGMRGCSLSWWAESHVCTCSTVPVHGTIASQTQFLELPIAAPLLYVWLDPYYCIFYLSRFFGTDRRSHGAISCEWRGCLIF